MKIIEPLTIHQLRHKGVAVNPGRWYVPAAWRSKHPPSLATVHRRLSKFKGTLAEEISRVRDEATG